MRVLLIYSNQRRDLFAAPPIGLCCVAGAAASAGHEVRVLDLCFRNKVRTAIEQAIAEFSPDVVGISIRNIDNLNLLYPVNYLPQTRELVKIVRRATCVPIVLGGAGASLMPGEILQYHRADYIVVSDGEQSFVNLLTGLERGDSSVGVPGIGLMVNGRFRLTAPTFTQADIPGSYTGRWIDLTPYRRLGSGYPIQTKRGCTHACIYCLYSSRLEGTRLRLRPPADVVDEMDEAVRRYHAKSFEFVDSVFNEPTDHCVQLLEEILRRPWKVTLAATSLTPGNLNRDMLDLMWRAGFRSFSMSPESASQTMIETYRKRLTAEQLIRAAEAINRTAFTVLWFFMIGGPGETNHTMQETLDFCLRYLKRNGHAASHVANLMLGVRLYPGTLLWETALVEGFVRTDANPLDQHWYLSDKLRLEDAISQMIRAARQSHEIISGNDERFMQLADLIAFLGRTLRVPGPYWSIVRTANLLFRRAGLLVSFKPRVVARMIRRQLDRQRNAPDVRSPR